MNTPAGWARSMLSVGASCAFGDCAAQKVTAPDPEDFRWDSRRTAEFVGVGACVMAPCSHLFEMTLERQFPGVHVKAIASKVMSRVVLAPCFLSVSFGALALVRGRDVWDAVSSSVWPAWKTGTLFWPAISVFQYRFVVVHWRPAFGSVVGAFWSTYLSWVAATNPGKRPDS
mmetsp:Transcript_18896/g.56143  ORF Transcript_18896/g.56143 Transcript_18896/m.56143 type:complete len:172 (-) Transcript_18896:24-539(-)